MPDRDSYGTARSGEPSTNGPYVSFCQRSLPSAMRSSSLLSTRLAVVSLSPRLAASPLSSNCHACRTYRALVLRRPVAAAQLEPRATSQLERQPAAVAA